MCSCPFKSLLGNQVGGLSLENKKGATTLSEGSTELLYATFAELQSGDRALRLKFVGLDEQDIITLTKLKPLIEGDIGEIVDHFYARVASIPQLTNIIQKHSTIDKLKKTLERYILDMLTGDIGENYIMHRKMIGKVHNQIGLFPEWYIGAYSIIQNEMLTCIGT